MKSKVLILSLLAALGMSCAAVYGGTLTIDFNSDPSSLLNYAGTQWDQSTTSHTGSTAWIKDGGVAMGATTNGPQKGVTGNGYLQITFAEDPLDTTQPLSSYLVGGVLFTNFDGNLVVAGFTFECDLRIGNGNPNPADGFSISYMRASDPILSALAAGSTLPDFNNSADSAGNGGAFSDNGNGGDPSLAEEGTQTGLSIGFDLWDSGNYTIPPASPAVGKVAPGISHDGIGLDIRVDDTLLTTISMPNGTTQATSDQFGNALTASDPNGNNAATDPTAIETGPYDGTGLADNLSWVHFKVVQGTDGLLNVYWKNTQILTNFQTHYSPSQGRLFMAARVGGNTANIDVDNIQLTTTPSSKAIIGSASPTSPTAFSVIVSDSGQSTFDAKAAGSITTFTLNGQAITPTSSTKDTNGLTTLFYDNPASPFPSGSTNTVVLAIKDSQGTAIAATNSFVALSYLSLNPATIAANVDKTKPGFTLRIAQVELEDSTGTAHGTDVNSGVAVASAERILHGDLGPNTADLSLYTGPGQTFNEKNVINYNAASGNIGEFADDGTVAGGTAAPNMPGMPGSATRENSYDDYAMEILTYIEFPTVGSYQLVFNSDDGFRTTTAANPKELINTTLVSQFDNGRGASGTAQWIYITTPGVYPFRTLYFQGGGGANCEWSATNPNGVHALLNDSTTPGALKTYAFVSAPNAAVSFADPPIGSGRPPTPDAPVVFEITDGATAVSNIKLTVNGATVTPAITKSGTVSKVVYTPSPLLPAGNNVAVISFTDGSTPYSGTNAFTTTAGTIVPASLALKSSDVDTTKPGFLIHTYQVNISNNGGGHNSPGNSTQVGEEQVHSWLGWPNVADLVAFTGPAGAFVEPAVINYNGSSGNIGTYPDDGTYGGTAPDMPGINGNTNLFDAGIDDYALEIRTVLDLQPGTYNMGVNSDDGFRMIVGDGKDAFTFPTVVGEFNGGRGADNWGFTRFSVNITKAGLYPFRMVYEEGGGGNNVEWFTVDKPWYPDMINKTLINGTSGIKAYQYPVNSSGPTYVQSISPARSITGNASVGRAGSDATVSAVLVDGSTPVNKSTVTLMVNGAAVTPTIAQANGQTTVSYKPAAGFPMGSTNHVSLSYNDITNTWTFIVNMPATPTFWIEAADFDYGGGQTKPEASIMPYHGGAYAGLAPVAGTDYDGPNDSDNPFYRSYPNSIKVPVSNAGDMDRGGGEVTVDYRLGWMGGHHWFNYTRTFPAGQYNAYIGLSSGSAGDHIYGNLEDVTGGVNTTLGAFSGSMVTTGGGTWGNNNLLPLKDAAATNSLVTLNLSGTKTLRYNDGSGDYDFILFTPVGGTAPTQPQITSAKVQSGTLTIIWTGGGTLQTSTDLKNWSEVSNSNGGTYSTAASGADAFFRVKQ